MDAPPPTAPPIEPREIPDPRARSLPVTAKTIATIDVVIGAMMLLVIFDSPDLETVLSSVFFMSFIPLGVGVLLRSSLARVLSRIAHGLFGVMMMAGLVATAIGLLGSGGQGQPVSGGLMISMIVFLTAWMLGLTAFFVWGFFVLGRKDVRDACRRPAR